MFLILVFVVESWLERDFLVSVIYEYMLVNKCGRLCIVGLLGRGILMLYVFFFLGMN
jgi:hypothetical protein